MGLWVICLLSKREFTMSRQTGRIWYGDKFVIIQRDGDATAVVSEMTWNGVSVVLTPVERWLSWSDAQQDFEKREAEFDRMIRECSVLNHRTRLCPHSDKWQHCPQNSAMRAI